MHNPCIIDFVHLLSHHDLLEYYPLSTDFSDNSWIFDDRVSLMPFSNLASVCAFKAMKEQFLKAFQIQ